MDEHFWKLDFQALVDLLAEETQLYTQAFIGSRQSDIDRHKTIIKAIIAEIDSRRSNGLPPDLVATLPPNDFFEGAA
jgi:lipid A disaccharide synthetase